MATPQHITLSDRATRLLVTTVDATPVLAFTNAHLYRIMDAVSILNKSKPIFTVEWGPSSGGFTNFLTFRPTNLVDTLTYKFVSTSTLQYQILFGGSAWDQDAINQASKVMATYIAFHQEFALSTSVASVGPFSGFISSPTLSTGLYGYWRMDEANGDRLDSHGAHTLKQVAGATNSVSGKNGNAARLQSGEQLSYNFATIYPATTDLTFSCWYRRTTNTDNNTLGFVQHTSLRCLNILPGAAGAGTVRLAAYDDSDSGTNVDIAGQNLTGAYFLLVARWDKTTRNWVLSINGGADSTAAVMGTTPPTVNVIAATGGGGDNDVDEVAVWLRRLTDAEVAELYDSGAGVFY
jgi:hypothetical protein